MTTEPAQEHSPTPFELLNGTMFRIGGENQLADRQSKWTEEPTDDDTRQAIETTWHETLADLHIRTGTLLKADTVSFLLGAGASHECGGPLIGTIPVELERKLLEEGISSQTDPNISDWLRCFYLVVQRLAGPDATTPPDSDALIGRRATLADGTSEALPINLELLLSMLYRWRAALPSEGGRLRIDGISAVDLRAEVIEECLHRTTSTLADLCELPTEDGRGAFDAYRTFLRKVLTRPLNLKRANIFTLNYDTLVEQAADAEGVVLVDGFVGTLRRTFRPECYDQDLYFPAETTEGRVHRLDRVLHLYKLHGSITWASEEPSWEDPYGVRAYDRTLNRNGKPVLIYPTCAKGGEVLGLPYSELLRHFASAVVRPQSVLFVLGYGFGDEHVNAILHQALAIPSFTLVLVDPSPRSRFVTTLLEWKDSRVWMLSGSTLGTFSGFVRYALADLRDEAIWRKVMETHRALADALDPSPSGGAVNG